MTTEIKLPIHNIVIAGNSITSDLTKGLSNDHDDCEMKAAMNAIESMILAHHCAGVNVDTQEYVIGIQVAVEACEAYYS